MSPLVCFLLDSVAVVVGLALLLALLWGMGAMLIRISDHSWHYAFEDPSLSMVLGLLATVVGTLFVLGAFALGCYLKGRF